MAESRVKATRAARLDVLPVDGNIVLGEATSKALGFGSVTVIAGKCPKDHSQSKFGTVSLISKLAGENGGIRIGKVLSEVIRPG
jgi:hypothetical protein